ncbi:hypothetical protein NQ315_016141 [Exocentrus adspersus]|uniref:Uncharacterized protein n=1 Tax=Exocentrus adspersus TaxID=1586481 RepID=A0AAV8VG39_9CUCU|nr:hypothetical protein NQ315_016141 [Exocentrus adspersus]
MLFQAQVEKRKSPYAQIFPKEIQTDIQNWNAVVHTVVVIVYLSNLQEDKGSGLIGKHLHLEEEQ